MVARGRLFAADVKGKFVTELPTNPRGRVLEARWLADNKMLLYNMTNADGLYQLVTIAADGSKPKPDGQMHPA
ncbi:MAG: hypothetical protein IPM36_06500, partial [Lewinellaceae bacterium]|nr:hypothetical protein [Lewinellaceae bacterium]